MIGGLPDATALALAQQLVLAVALWVGAAELQRRPASAFKIECR
jgi:hypothetical protein